MGNAGSTDFMGLGGTHHHHSGLLCLHVEDIFKIDFDFILNMFLLISSLSLKPALSLRENLSR